MIQVNSINVLSLPFDGGSPIVDLQFRLNGGPAVSLQSASTGSYPIPATPGDLVELRAVNAVGPGEWSAVKTVEEVERPFEPPEFILPSEPDSDGNIELTSFGVQSVYKESGDSLAKLVSFGVQVVYQEQGES